MPPTAITIERDCIIMQVSVKVVICVFLLYLIRAGTCDCAYPFTGATCEMLDYCGGVDCGEGGACSQVISDTG